MRWSRSIVECHAGNPYWLQYFAYIWSLTYTRVYEGRLRVVHMKTAQLSLFFQHTSVQVFLNGSTALNSCMHLEQKMGAHVSGNHSSAGLPLFLSMVWLLTQASRLCTVVYNTCAVTLVWYMLYGDQRACCCCLHWSFYKGSEMVSVDFAGLIAMAGLCVVFS